MIEPLSIASAEVRLAEVLAQIAYIGREIEEARYPESKQWRTTAMKARDELRAEMRSLERFIASQRAKIARGPIAKRRADDLARQDADRATKDARKLAKKEHRTQLWDLYLRIEVALLAIIKAGGDAGPLGDSLLRAANDVVPEWYREHWLRTVYGTTWGREAERARGER